MEVLKCARHRNACSFRCLVCSSAESGSDINEERHKKSEFEYTVKYQFPIGIRQMSEIRLRDEVHISRTKGSRCRGKYRSLNGIPNPYTVGQVIHSRMA
jgi:hypothetical protein